MKILKTLLVLTLIPFCVFAQRAGIDSKGDGTVLLSGKLDGDTNVVDFTSADTRVADPLRGDAPVTLEYLQDTLGDLAALVIYGSTNAHPVLAGYGSMVDAADIPSAQTVVVSLPGNTLTTVGSFAYTNATDAAREGKLFGLFFMSKDGSPPRDIRSRMIHGYTNHVTGASGVFDTSAFVPIDTVILNAYRLNVTQAENLIDPDTNTWITIDFQITNTTAQTTTATLYLGDPYDTHLEISAGIGRAAGYLLPGDSVDTLNTLKGDIVIQDGTNTSVRVDGQNIYIDADAGVTEAQVKRFAPLMTNSTELSLGVRAESSYSGVALGRDAVGTYSGVALGRETDAHLWGVSVGLEAISTNLGVAVGRSAEGWDSGVAIGYIAKGVHEGVAIGKYSEATNNNVAIGAGVTNTEPNSTRIKGTLNMNDEPITNAELVQTETLQITGGTPAVGDVFAVTNINGTGKLINFMELESRTINVATNESIQDAFDSIAKYIPYGVTITVQPAAGTHTISSTINIAGFIGGGAIMFSAESYTSATNTAQTVFLDGSGLDANVVNVTDAKCAVTIRGMKIALKNSVTGYRGISVTSSSALEVWYSYIYGTTTDRGEGLRAEKNSNVFMRQNLFANTATGIRAARNSFITAQLNAATGTPPSGGYAAVGGGIITKNTSTTGSSFVGTGGLIVETAGAIIP